jgi:predicted O-methyltransferase YrrM
MTYVRSTAADALRALGRSAADTKFWRAVGRTALEHEFESGAGPFRRLALEQLNDGTLEVRLALPRSSYGETPYVDLLGLALLVARRAPRTVFEFGTYTGRGTWNIALNAPGSHVRTLDLDPATRSRLAAELNWEAGIDDAKIGRFLDDARRHATVEQVLGDSASIDLSSLDGQMDFVFVDADHEYPAVVNDSRHALRMAREGTVIAWHDRSRVCPGVQQRLRELATEIDITVVQGTQLAFTQIKDRAQAERAARLS